ncbi:MAG: hypothetical protein ABIH87_00915 [bacterium]
MDKRLKQSIIKTLAYYDQFDHPLTKEELFRFLWQPPAISYGLFLQELEILGIDCKYGYYFLPGREKLVEIRRSRTVDNDHKHLVARRSAKKIRWVPFVRAMLVCNNTSFEMAGQKSDIDVVIVAKQGRIWLARMFATLLLSIFCLRRTGKKTTNRICLSFYATDQALNFYKLKIAEPDIGLMYWIMQFVSIYDPNGIQEKILEQNQWIRTYLPNAFLSSTMGHRFMVKDNIFTKALKFFWEKSWQGMYGDTVEKQCKAMQKNKMSKNIHSVQDEPDTRVVISDEILKFHEKDRRIQYKEEWERRINKITCF